MADKVNTELNLKVTGDVGSAKSEIKKLFDLLKSGKVDIDLNTKGLSDSATKARKMLDEKLLSKKSISVDLDTSKLEKQLSSISTKAQTVKIGVDISEALKGLQTLKKEIDKIDGRIIQVKTHTTNTVTTEKRGNRTSTRADENPNKGASRTRKGKVVDDNYYRSLAERRNAEYLRAEKAFQSRGENDIQFRLAKKNFERLTMMMNSVGNKVGATSLDTSIKRLETLLESRLNQPDSNPVKQMLTNALQSTAQLAMSAQNQLRALNPIRSDAETEKQLNYEYGIRKKLAQIDLKNAQDKEAERKRFREQDDAKHTKEQRPNQSYQSFNKEIGKNIIEAEKAWRNAGNKTSATYEKIHSRIIKLLDSSMAERKARGGLSYGQEIGTLQRIQRSVEGTPLFKELDNRIKNLRLANTEQRERTDPRFAQKRLLVSERNEMADWKRSVRNQIAGLDAGEKLSAKQYLYNQKIQELQGRATSLEGVNGSEEKLARTKRAIEDLIAKEKELARKIAESNAKYDERIKKAALAADKQNGRAQRAQNLSSAVQGNSNFDIKHMGRAGAGFGSGGGRRGSGGGKNEKDSTYDYGAGRFNAGRLADYFTSWKGISTLFSNAIRFFGRSSKGVGSAGEATAGLTSKMASLGRVATLASVALGGIVAAGALVGTAFTILKGAATQLADGLIQILKTIYNILEPGIKLYSDSTKASMAISAGVQANAKIDGRAPTQQEASSIGKQLTQRAILDAMQSVFDPNEIITALQGTLPMFLNKGMSVEQAYQVTRGVAGVAKLTRLAPNQVLQESRDLAQGTISARSSQVANTLGITQEDIKKFQGDVDGLFDYLMEKFKHYTETLEKYSETPVGALENLKETWSVAMSKIVEEIAPPFATVFKNLSSQLGYIADETGRRTNAGGFLIDKNGNYVDKEGNLSETPVKGEGKIDFKVSDMVKDFGNMVQDVIEHLLKKASELSAYISAGNDSKSTFEAIGNGIKSLINLLEWLLECCVDVYRIGQQVIQWIKDFINFLSALGDILNVVLLVIAVLNPEIGILILGLKLLIEHFNYVVDAISLLGQACAVGTKLLAILANGIIAALRAAWEYITTLPKGTDAAKAAFTNEFNNGEFAQKNAKLVAQIKNDLQYMKSFEVGADRGVKDGEDPLDIIGSYRRGQAKGKPEDGDYVDPATAQGQAKNADEIKKLQSAMKDKLKELKDELKDKLDEIKDQLKQNDLKFKQGFMTVNQYYMEKARLEKEEAQLSVDELKQEIEEIQKTPYEKDEDKARDLRETTRELRKASRALEQASRGLADTQRALEDGANFTKQLIQRERAQNGQVGSNGMYSTNAATVYNMMKSQGFTNHNMLIGILASLRGEALNNPKDEHMDRYADGTPAGLATGIAQWRAERREGLFNFAEENKSDPYHILTQIAWLITELNTTEKANLQEVIKWAEANGGTAEAYTKAFTALVERPAGMWDEGANRTQFISEVEQAVRDGVAVSTSGGDITSKIDNALTGENGLLGKTLTWIDRACVEAVTKIGSSFSNVLDEAVQRGIVNTEDLDQFLEGKGIGKEKFNKANLQPGDIIYFDSEDEQNAHVMMYKGNGMITGNSTRQEKVIEQDLDSYLKYAKLTPTFVRKTGSTGGIVQKPSEYYSSDTSYAASEELKKANEKWTSLAAQNESIRFGQIDAQMNELLDKWAEEIQEITDKWKDNPELLERLKQETDTKYSYDALVLRNKVHEDTLNVQHSTQNNEFGWGNVNFDREFRDPKSIRYMIQRNLDYYFKVEDGIFNMARTLDGLWDDYRGFQNAGNLGKAKEIRDKIMSTYQDVYKMFSGWLDQYKEQLEQYSTWVENNPDFTTLQKENGQREIKARENRYIYDFTVGELKSTEGILETLNTYYDDMENRMASVKKQLAEVTAGTEEHNKLLKEQADIQTELDITKQKQFVFEQQKRQLTYTKLQSEQLMHQKDILVDFRRTAKQAFEDGLNKFLTDGILEAESLGDAFRNMLVGMLKEIQQFFAKELTLQLMNSLFPTVDENGLTRYSRETGYGAQRRARKDIGGQGANSPEDFDLLANNPFNQPWNKSSLNKNYKPWEDKDAFKVDDKFAKPNYHDATKLTDFGMNLEQASQTVGKFDFSTKSAADATSDMAKDMSVDTATNTMVTSFGNATTAANNLSSALNSASMASGASAGGVNTENRASGGLITGAGTSTSDSIPAMLSNGEFVMRAKAVRQMGTNFMHAVNRGDFNKIRARIPRFATGGVVGDAQQETARGMTDFAKTVGTSVSTTNNMSIAVVDNKEQAMEHFMRSPKGQRFVLDTIKGSGRAITQMSFSN